VNAAISVNADVRVGIINENIYGHFLEMTYQCFYGGLWAEMLKHRKFEADDGEGPQYGVVKPWYAVGRTPNCHFMHDNTVFSCGSQSQKIVSREKPPHTSGVGQGGLVFEQSKSYEVRINLRQEGIQSPILVSLRGRAGVYAGEQILLPTSDWTRHSFTLRPSRTDRDGHVTITFSGEGTLWLGSVSLMPEDHMSGFRRDVIEVVREIKPPNIRWPGGNFVSYYHWEDGIGDRDRRPPRPNYARSGVRGEEWEANEQWEPNDVGTDEFLELCRLTGARPYMAVNAGDGTPEEAAHLVEYCNGAVSTEFGAKRRANGHPEPYNVRLWGIGNESYGNWQGGHVDEETYARRHRDIARAMRSVDPNIKIVAVGARSWFAPHWNEALLGIAEPYVDFVSLHSYAKKYRSFVKKEELVCLPFAEEFYYYIVASPHGVEEQIALTAAELNSKRKSGSEIAIAFDEWNCWAYNAPEHSVDFAVRDGLYAAGMFHAFRRQSNVLKLANFSMLVNCLPLIRVDRRGLFLNPQYLVFKMYMNHQGPALLRSSVECETFPAPEYEAGRPQAAGRIPYLDASCTLSEDGSTLYMGIINRHDREDIKTEIAIEGWIPRPKGKRIWLDGGNYLTENTFDQPGNITIKEEALGDIKPTFTHTFPPHSVTVLELYGH
jgi:alpha-N-arabinofuranosidase